MSQNPKTRASLILRLKDTDDAAAWQDFTEIYQPLIYSLARRRGLQEADAYDLTQEVLSRVARFIDTWDPDPARGSFRGWLATITRNMVVEFFRKNSRLPKTGNRTEIQELLNNQPGVTNESNEFDLEHDRQVFAWAAGKIKSQFEHATWQAFWLTAVAGQTILETANQLNMTRGAVYVARSRVMSRLKKVVQRSEFDSMIGKVSR